MPGTSKLSTRFTMRLPNEIHDEGEARALGTGKSVAQLIVDELRRAWKLPGTPVVIAPPKRGEKHSEVTGRLVSEISQKNA